MDNKLNRFTYSWQYRILMNKSVLLRAWRWRCGFWILLWFDFGFQHSELFTMRHLFRFPGMCWFNLCKHFVWRHIRIIPKDKATKKREKLKYCWKTKADVFWGVSPLKMQKVEHLIILLPFEDFFPHNVSTFSNILASQSVSHHQPHWTHFLELWGAVETQTSQNTGNSF